MPGLEKQVEVYFDTYGIPHIYAQSESDAYYALGYVHAQERLFQMDLMRRVGSGRLAEIFGNDLVETDKFFRTLGIAQKAEEYAKSFNPDSSHAVAMAVAYAKGINQFIEQGKTPIEYTLLGIEKEKFIPSDFYNISGYMAYSFASAFKIEPIVSKVFEQYGTEYLPDMGI
ncbi:MAG TPA: penicillin acylase family protein, partial [Bacteroidales bacterium]|nr:penicillin acylase family protein [Bacteroidales bacterium]